MPGAPYYGTYGPMAAGAGAGIGGNWGALYSGYLPRQPWQFTQGAFGPAGPVLPTPVDQPPEGAERPEPRRYEYRVGWNLPVGEPGSEGLKLASFGTLKTLADLYSVARTCIQLRKSEVCGLDWDIIPTHEAAKAYKGDRDAMRDFGERRGKAVKFFRHPDPDYFSFSSWLNALLEEVFVFDALSVLLRPKWGKGKGKGLLGSDLDSLELINGATIRPLIGLHGEIPRPPAPAYQQYLFGVPRSDFMTMITQRDIEESGLTGSEIRQFRGDQLLYLPMVPRRWTPYGFPPIERALIPTMSGLQKQAYQLNWFQEGTVPAAYISPGDTNMTPNQLRELQDALNAFAGDPAWKHKIIVLPPGSRVDPLRNPQIADQFDEIVMSQVCMAFDVQPLEIGIVPRVSAVASPFASREMAQASRQVHERVSTKPLLKFLADVFDAILHRIAGQDDMKFTFEGLQEEQDANMMTQMLVQQVQNGIRSVDEAREELEIEPWGLPATSGPVVFTAQGVIPFGPIPQQAEDGGSPAGGVSPPGEGMSGDQGPTWQGNPGAPVSFTGDDQAYNTPGHDAASAGAAASSATEVGTPGGGAPASGPPALPGNRMALPAAPSLPSSSYVLHKGVSAELEALTRLIKKGRDPSTWEPRYLPAHAPALVANALISGIPAGDVPEKVKQLILGTDDYEWAPAQKADDESGGARPKAWAAWSYDHELVNEYTKRLGDAFGAAISQAADLITKWWHGQLNVTRAGLVSQVSDLVRRHVGPVLLQLWREAWFLGNRAAKAAVTGDNPEMGKWKPGSHTAAKFPKDTTAFEAHLNTNGASAINAIASTRMDDLAQAIAGAIRAGDDSSALIAGMPAILNTGPRAAMIAKTEVARTIAAASLERFFKGGVTRKAWVIAPSEEGCLVCRGNRDDGSIPLESAFQSGNIQPPAHPGCRCAVLPTHVNGKELTPLLVPPAEKVDAQRDFHGRFAPEGTGAASPNEPHGWIPEDRWLEGQQEWEHRGEEAWHEHEWQKKPGTAETVEPAGKKPVPGQYREGYTPSTFINPLTNREMSKTETGDTFEAMFAARAGQMMREKFGGDYIPISTTGAWQSRQTELDFKLDHLYGGELKTLNANAKNQKTAMRAEQVTRKLQAIEQEGLRPLLVVQVVDMANNRVEVYFYFNFVSKAVSRMEYLGFYSFSKADFEAAQRASGWWPQKGENAPLLKSVDDDGAPETGDTVIELRDGVPIIYTWNSDTAQKSDTQRDYHGRFSSVGASQAPASAAAAATQGWIPEDKWLEGEKDWEAAGEAAWRAHEWQPGPHDAPAENPHDVLGRASLSDNQRDVLDKYTERHSKYINQYLRWTGDQDELEDTVGPTDDLEEMSKSLDKLFESQPVTHSAFTLWRGTTNRELGSLGEIKPGNTITDPGFLSTTSDEEHAKNYPHSYERKTDGVILEIHVPKGAKAISIERTMNRPAEREVLLPRDTKLEIQSVSDGKVVANLVLDKPNTASQSHEKPLEGDKLWFDNHKEGTAPNISQEEIQTARNVWFGRHFRETSAFMRGQQDLKDPEKIFDIISFEKLVRRATPFSKPVQLYRGMGANSAQRIFGDVGSMVGRDFTDMNFVAATASRDMAHTYAPRNSDGVQTIVQIVAPAGTQALRAELPFYMSFDNANDWDAHREFVFPPDSVFHITGDKMTTEKDVSGKAVKVRQVEVTVEKTPKPRTLSAIQREEQLQQQRDLHHAQQAARV